MGVYLQASDLKSMSEFPVVKAKDAGLLESVYITRAEIMAGSYGPFVYAADRRDEFRTQMRLAVFLVAERLVLGQPSTAAAATGITSESIGRYSYSRASGGGNVGKQEAPDVVTAEAEAIFTYWASGSGAELVVDRTAVFEQNYYTDDEDDGLKVFASEMGPPQEWVGQSQ